MEIEIMNYEGKKAKVNIKDFDKVQKIYVEVISGDEILHILDDDYEEKRYDSAYLLENPRIMDFFDGKYTIYHKNKNINEIEEWKKRKDSYNWEI